MENNGDEGEKDKEENWVGKALEEEGEENKNNKSNHNKKNKVKNNKSLFVCLFVFLTSSSTTRLYRGRAPRQERLTILRAATHETELGDHDFCLSRSHYTDTDPTCRERAATAGIEPGTSSPGVARSTAELPRPPQQEQSQQEKQGQEQQEFVGLLLV